MNSAGEIMPRSRMPPAQQGLAAGDAVVPEADAGLVVHLEPAVGDRLAQIGLQDVARLDAGVHLRLEEPVGAPPGRLRRIHRQVGVLEELVEVGAVLRRQRDADAGVGGDLVTQAFVGLPDRLDGSA